MKSISEEQCLRLGGYVHLRPWWIRRLKIQNKIHHEIREMEFRVSMTLKCFACGVVESKPAPAPLFPSSFSLHVSEWVDHYGDGWVGFGERRMRWELCSLAIWLGWFRSRTMTII